MRTSFLCLIAAATLALPAGAVDVVSASNLKTAPAQPAPGQEAQITFDAANVAGTPVDLNWQILVGTDQVRSGHERVAARAKKGALTRWTAICIVVGMGCNAGAQANCRQAGTTGCTGVLSTTAPTTYTAGLR
jgi:hypothetical protein